MKYGYLNWLTDILFILQCSVIVNVFMFSFHKCLFLIDSFVVFAFDHIDLNLTTAPMSNVEGTGDSVFSGHPWDTSRELST